MRFFHAKPPSLPLATLRTDRKRTRVAERRNSEPFGLLEVRALRVDR